jgi:hypothetical protein
LPGIWFDPNWGFITSDLNKDSTNRSLENADIHHFYEGSFGWHWHGLWDKDPAPKSKWTFLEKSFEDKISS